MAMVVPDSIRAKCPDAVRTLTANAKRLVTCYDLYATQMAIANGNICTPQANSTLKRGYSLFTELVNANRTCHQAYIPKEYCPCDVEMYLSPDTPMARNAANGLVELANRIIYDNKDSRGKCAELSVKRWG
jgi:hypothetical protein